MIAGAICGVIIILLAVGFSKLGQNGQENVKKAGNVAGWIFAISILIALFFSAYPAMVNVPIQYPGVFFLNFIIEPLAGATLAYGLVWLVMRPKAAKKIHKPFLWHSCGVAATVIGSAIFRIIAMITFAGRSAYEPASQTGAAGFYMLIIPAIIATGYIAWLKKRPTGIGDPTPHFETKDVLADASVIDATYEKIDQELATDNLDRATWTRAQGDAEGNAERAKALYIRYRAQRLLAASRDEKTRLSTIQGSSPAEPPKKRTSNSALAFIVAAVVGVALIGFVIKQSIAPSFIQLPEKPDLSQGNRLATPEEESKLVPWPVDLSKGAMDWSRVAPEKARDESDLQAEQRTRRAEEVISIRYPNWRDITGSKNGNPTAYRKWLATQPADYQAKINSTWNANDIIESIDKFKTDTK